jgi:hypothetical protein
VTDTASGHRLFAIVSRRVIDDDTAPELVIYEDPVNVHDSGYCVYAAADLDDPVDDDNNYVACCIACLIGARPGIGDALVVARVDGVWRAADYSDP